MSALQRLAAAACGSGLGFRSAGIAAAAAASSASSSASWLRGYADAAGGSGDKPAEQPAEAAAAEAAAAADAGDTEGAFAAAAGIEEEAPAAQQTHPALIDPFDGTELPAEMFSKRQLAWMGVEDPGRYKHFLPRLSRKELGSFWDEYVEEEFDVEAELYPSIPDSVPLYDLRKTVPEIYEPHCDPFERLQRLKAERYPNMPLDQFVKEVVGIDAPEEQPPRPGARRIIRWQVRHVFAAGVNEGHPANKRVKAWVYLRDLQREHGLTDAALQHIAAICGPRYNPNKGLLQLSSDRYPHREANRAHIRQVLDALVAEGHAKFPAQQQAAAAAP